MSTCGLKVLPSVNTAQVEAELLLPQESELHVVVHVALLSPCT